MNVDLGQLSICHDIKEIYLFIEYKGSEMFLGDGKQKCNKFWCCQHEKG